MEDDFSVLWRPAIDGVEVLHARFRRHEYAKHAHDAATVALVDTGTVSFDYRGERFLAPAGSVFLLDTDRAHTGRAASSAGYRYRVLYLDTDVLRPFLTPEAGRPPRLAFRDTVVWDSTLVALLDRTHRALTTPGRRRRPSRVAIGRCPPLVTTWRRTRRRTCPCRSSPTSRGRVRTGWPGCSPPRSACRRTPTKPGCGSAWPAGCSPPGRRSPRWRPGPASMTKRT